MAYRMILQHELRGQRCVSIERNRRRAVEILIAERPDRRRCRGAVALQQIDRVRGRRAGVLIGVARVHGVDACPGDAGDRLSGGEHAGELDLHRVDAGDVVHDHPDAASVAGQPGRPLLVGQGRGVPGERGGTLFESRGQRLGARRRSGRGRGGGAFRRDDSRHRLVLSTPSKRYRFDMLPTLRRGSEPRSCASVRFA